MGVLNATPDSFSDGGLHLAPDDALARLAQVALEGAAICDVGAESTRPGAAPVAADEQLRRIAPILEAIAGGSPIAISIDTSSARVAGAALAAGAVLVNDITAGRGDPDMFAMVAERGAAICLMHMKGDPQTMQDAPVYDDPVGEVCAFLEARLRAAVDAGIPERHVVLDPGIGFGKRLSDNLALLAHIDAVAAMGRPVVVGVSRKRMFEPLIGRPVGERLAGSLSAGLAVVARGAHVLRVHDVRETCDALRVQQAVEEAR
jgi:dihydropteroate synthase